jgi:hypothetical protein
VNNGVAGDSLSFAAILKRDSMSPQDKQIRASLVCQIEQDRRDICSRECNVIITGIDPVDNSNNENLSENDKLKNVFNILFIWRFTFLLCA